MSLRYQCPGVAKRRWWSGRVSRCSSDSPLLSLQSSWRYYTTNALCNGVRLGYNKGDKKVPTTATFRATMERTTSFGYWLRRRRKALDLTQDELARQVGCAVGTIKKLEGDERRPSKQLAERLA